MCQAPCTVAAHCWAPQCWSPEEGLHCQAWRGGIAKGTSPASWVCQLGLGGREGQGGDICLTLLSASVTWCVFSQQLITLQHVLINIWNPSRVETEQNFKRVVVWSGDAEKSLAAKNGRW